MSPHKKDSNEQEIQLRKNEVIMDLPPKIKFQKTRNSFSKTKLPDLDNEGIKLALIELYVAIKVRNDEQMENCTPESLKLERKQLYESNIDIFTLILYIKTTF